MYFVGVDYTNDYEPLEQFDTLKEAQEFALQAQNYYKDGFVIITDEEGHLYY